MRTSLNKIGDICLIACATMVIALPALAKNDQPKESYATVQVGGSPVFMITNTGSKDKPVDIELDLYSSTNPDPIPYIWDDQVIEPGASGTYDMGSLPLNPGGSPYHVALRISSSHNSKLITEIDPIATFIVYHGGCTGIFCH